MAHWDYLGASARDRQVIRVPALRLDLEIRDGVADDIRDWLQDGEVDIALSSNLNVFTRAN